MKILWFRSKNSLVAIAVPRVCEDPEKRAWEILTEETNVILDGQKVDVDFVRSLYSLQQITELNAIGGIIGQFLVTRADNYPCPMQTIDLS